MFKVRDFRTSDVKFHHIEYNSEKERGRDLACNMRTSSRVQSSFIKD